MKYRIEISNASTAEFYDEFESDDINEIGDGSDYCSDWLSDNGDELFDWRDEDDLRAVVAYKVFENDVLIHEGEQEVFPDDEFDDYLYESSVDK